MTMLNQMASAACRMQWSAHIAAGEELQLMHEYTEGQVERFDQTSETGAEAVHIHI